MRPVVGPGCTVLVAAALLLAGCASGPSAATPVPTFRAEVTTTRPPEPGPVGTGVVPADCTPVLAPADLGALLGLPMGGVAVRSTVGVPIPAVGRTERLDCAYTGTQDAGPARGRDLLSVGLTAYSDADAARAQWQRNLDAEDGDRRDVPLGAASATLVERRGEALLSVLYGSGTVGLLLPDRPLPGGRSVEDVLVDLALRVLPAIAGSAPASAAASSSSAAPVRAAGPHA